MQALGKDSDEEYKENTSQISEELNGNNIGLLFTHRKEKKIAKVLESHVHPDFARTGSTATESFELPQGILSVNGVDIMHSMEPFLRKLGLPTTLKNGKVILLRNFVVCNEGDVLTSDQSHLLKLFDIKMAEFKVLLTGFYTDGKFKLLKQE